MVSKKSRPRRSAEETRRVLVAEGLRQLEVSGVDFGLEHVTLESACAATNVPRSSSHAAWAINDDYAPQAFFQRTVLQEWLRVREGATFASAAAGGAIGAALEEHGDSLSRHELARLGIQAALAVGLASNDDGHGSGLVSTDMAIKHTLASQPTDDRDPDIVEWVRKSEIKNRDDRIADSYRPLAELLGVEPRPEYGDAAYGHMAVAVASLTEGIAMREIVAPELNVANESIRVDAESTIPVTLLGVCVEALMDKFFVAVGAAADG